MRRFESVLFLVLAGALTPQATSVAHAGFWTRAFSQAEIAQFQFSSPLSGNAWAGNTLTLNSGMSFVDLTAGFLPLDAVGIQFTFIPGGPTSGADVFVSKQRLLPPNDIATILTDVVTQVDGGTGPDLWRASISGVGIAQRVDDVPAISFGDGQIVNFFFAQETLNAASSPDLLDYVGFTTGNRPGIVYQDVSWILAGSDGNYRSDPPPDIQPVPAPSALSLVGIGVLSIACSSRMFRRNRRYQPISSGPAVKSI